MAYRTGHGWFKRPPEESFPTAMWEGEVLAGDTVLEYPAWVVFKLGLNRT